MGLFYRDGSVDGESNPEKLKLRAEILHAIEEGNNPTAELADYVATRNVEQILDTMERLGIRYDLLARESEILHLHFWERAFQLMKDRGVIHFAGEGRNRGCWVMPFESHTGTDEHESDKIIVRSNGTVTYTGKDIAYQLWKLGQLGLDFNYKPFQVLSRWPRHLGHDHRAQRRNPTGSPASEFWRRRDCLQRDRFTPVLPAGHRPQRRRGNRARVRRRGERASFLRDGRAIARRL